MEIFTQVAFTSDFGLSDHYVAVTKSVILSRVKRQLSLFDVSHMIPRHKIPKAAYVAATAAKYMGKSTIHLVVVDPGVGTPRRVAAYKTEANGVFIAPDNGVLTYAFRWFKGSILFYKDAVPEYASATFHARDVFAPLVADIANGMNLDEKFAPGGPPPIELPYTEFSKNGREIRGSVIYVDVFGNIVTNIPNETLHSDIVRLKAQGREYTLHRKTTYSEGGKGEVIIIGGSEGFYEIAVNMGSAASAVGIQELSEVTLVEE